MKRIFIIKGEVISFKMVVDKIDSSIVSSEAYPCFGSEKVYRESFEIASKLFPDLKYLGMNPKFFEMYKNKQDSGIVVDAQKLEVRFNDVKNADVADKLMTEFYRKGLSYTYVFNPKQK